MTSFIARIAAELMVLTFGGASTACAESGRDYTDGAAVLQVVTNRARSGWARYDGTLLDALYEPAQHATSCRWPLTVEHLRLGLAFATRRLEPPPWARRALWYCGRWDRAGLCESRCASAPCEAVGGLAHTFYARPGEGR